MKEHIALCHHLKGIQAIGELFGVSRRTVRDWTRRGAPIRLVGRKYQASYHDLWAWVFEHGCKSNGGASSSSGPLEPL